MKEQDWFANQAALLELSNEWTARQLLDELQGIEKGQGRDRSPDAKRFGPRTLDLDILLFGDVELDTPELILPHPRMFERAFVLAPLIDIAPDLVFPDGRSIKQVVAKIQFQVHNNHIWQ